MAFATQYQGHDRPHDEGHDPRGPNAITKGIIKGMSRVIMKGMTNPMRKGTRMALPRSFEV